MSKKRISIKITLNHNKITKITSVLGHSNNVSITTSTGKMTINNNQDDPSMSRTLDIAVIISSGSITESKL